MALRYLLDTNMVSDLIRHPQGTVANRIASVGENTVCTGIVIAAELRYGAELLVRIPAPPAPDSDPT